MIEDKRLIKILQDNRSGSTKLLLKINSYFRAIEGHPDLLSERIELFKKRFSDFQVIINYLEKLKSEVNKSTLHKFIASFTAEIKTVHERIYQNAKNDLIKLGSALVLSHSNTLYEIIKLWYNDNPMIKISVLESRPKLEGRKLAAGIGKLGIKTELLTDAAMAIGIKKTDAVIIGADIILKNENVVNKIGSKPAALVSKYYDKPFYVAASKYKKSNQEIYQPELKKSDEVWNNNSSSHISVFNYYFEEIERDLITKIITD